MREAVVGIAVNELKWFREGRGRFNGSKMLQLWSHGTWPACAGRLSRPEAIGWHRSTMPPIESRDGLERSPRYIMGTRVQESASRWSTESAENFEAFLTRLGQKGLAAVERHVEL